MIPYNRPEWPDIPIVQPGPSQEEIDRRIENFLEVLRKAVQPVEENEVC